MALACCTEVSRGRGSRRTQRLAALVLAVIAVPAVLSADGALRDAPIVVGEPSPRTVVAPDLIRVGDPEATAVARDDAAVAVAPVLISDDEAPAAIVREVREAFATARSVRGAAAGAAALDPEEQVEALVGRLTMLDEAGLRRLVELSDAELSQVAAEAVGIAQLYARQTVGEGRVDDAADRLLRIELAVRPLPEGVGDAVVAPVLRAALRPTVREDAAATAATRERSAAAVSEVPAYHDIGKVRRPSFFVENQFGVANPHDELAPEASAGIIRAHVPDGVALARAHHLPAEVIEGIASHHGATLVSYFHRKALAAAGPGERVDADAFHYPGPKPASRETAVLMLADCCEGAARALAQADRNLSGTDLEGLVARMVGERLADGQLYESALTLRDLSAVKRSFIETLTGVYHPRIAYPPAPAEDAAGGVGRKGEVTRRTA